MTLFTITRKKKYESLVGGQFSIEEGHAEFLDANTVEIDGKRLSGEKILIATGSRSVVPPIEGLETVPYLTSDLLTNDEPMELTECPKSLLIVGGGYIALELGQMFARFGAKVTILERNAQLLAHGYEQETGRVIKQIFKEEGINVVAGATLRSVRQENGEAVATVETANGISEEFRAEKLLAATSRQPNTDRIVIEKSGVALGKQGQVIVNEYLQTNVPHIFAAGDIIGSEQNSQMATPVGSQDGGIVALNALSNEEMRSVNHRVVPH